MARFRSGDESDFDGQISRALGFAAMVDCFSMSITFFLFFECQLVPYSLKASTYLKHENSTINKHSLLNYSQPYDSQESW